MSIRRLKITKFDNAGHVRYFKKKINTVESFKFVAANFRGFFAHSRGCIFVDASVTALVTKITLFKIVFIENLNLWGSATHEYHEN